jgi:arylsulfatase A-like enzyme
VRRALASLLLLLWYGACSHAPPSPLPSDPPSPAGPSLPLRLVDQAGAATLEGDLDTAYAALTHPLVSPSPLPAGAATPRALQVTFAEPDLSRLLDPGGRRARPPAPTNIDLTWNRTRGVYEAREALFVPAGVRYRYALPAGGAARLSAEVALAPGSEPVRVGVWMGSERVGEIATTAADAGRWRPIAVELPARARATELVIGAERGGGALFLGAAVVHAARAEASRPNVLFVVVDTLRADALSAMPRLSALAAQGARFSQAITAATWTRPSLIAALGGDLPTRLGHSAEDMIPTDRERRRFRALRPPLLPRRLAAAGWETRAIGNNFFLLGFPRIGLDLGIDAVTDVRDLVQDTPAITAEAIRFLQRPHDAPFFLYLHYDAPHWPYTPPPAALAAARGKRLGSLEGAADPMIPAYLGEAAWADGALGQLFDALDRAGLAERTVVVVIGDHGEIFDPAHAHRVEALGQPTLHHHGWSAYDEIGRVPFVVRWSGHVAPRVVETQTSLVDLAPTVAALVGLPSEVGHPLVGPLEPTRGRSLAAALLGPPDRWPEPPRPAFIEGQNVRALRADGWLYLVRGDGRLVRGATRLDQREELYELASDPLQHTDRSADPTAPLERLRARFAQSAPALPPFAEPVVHLALAEDARPHLLRGEVRCPTGQLAVRAIERGRATPSPGRGVAIELEAGGRVDLLVDPPEAALELVLRRDELPIDADHLLVGPLALPLLGGSARQAAPAGAIALPAQRLSWLDAARAPEPGERGEVLLWRDPGAAGDARGAGRTASADGEVATMMQRWGYAQPAAAKP